MLINDTGNTLEDFTQSKIRITLLAHIDDTHDYQLSLIAPTDSWMRNQRAR